MRKEKFTCYWIGQEPTGPGQSPELNTMPSYVDVIPLAFVTIKEQQLDFAFLTQHNSASVIKGWVKEVRAKGSKVLLSIIGQELDSIADPAAFAKQIQEAMQEWEVDGIDFDYEPPNVHRLDNYVAVVQQARELLGNDVLLTMPIYQAWYVWDYPDMDEETKAIFQKIADALKQLGTYLDYFTTMDYTPYGNVGSTTDNFMNYAKSIGSVEKIAIGVSCMDFTDRNHTPLDDVIKLCKWEPDGGTKQGMMNYTFSYDIKIRMVNGKDVGTGEPDGTWTQTIQDNLC